jgi:hypothetical protein
MNVFFLDQAPEQCVRYMNDSHVSKMILESAQILSTVVHVSGVEKSDAVVYKPTHHNHPCVRWAGDSLSNWRFLRFLSSEMNREFGYRFGGSHLSARVIANLPEPSIPDVGDTLPARAIPDTLRIKLGAVKSINDVVFSYRVFYNLHKRHLAKWTGRPIPSWWERSASRVQLLRQSVSPSPFSNFFQEKIS